MSGIPRFRKENIGSLIKIEYAPAITIQQMDQLSDTQISAAGIQFKGGYGWQPMYCTQDTMGHQQDMTNGDNGQSFTHQVVGFIPGDEVEVEAALLPLLGLRHVLRITLANGTVKIVGSKTYPLEPVVKSTTATQYGSRAGSAITFSAQSLGRALFYVA